MKKFWNIVEANVEGINFNKKLDCICFIKFDKF